jgi:UDP-2,4-diacetamido-2,4,6-trideoxy-beta-L-altropyranose hydrolase
LPPPLRAVFRVDASVEIGGGHVQRCLALGRALLEDGWSVHFASARETVLAVPSVMQAGLQMITVDESKADAGLRTALPAGCDLLVVDNYGLDEKFERCCRSWTRRILVIDDLADRPHDCDVLVDQSPGRQRDGYRALVPAHCQILTGGDYALLDSPFAEMRAKILPRDGTVRRILVSLGATDPTGVTVRVLTALEQAGLGVPVDVIIGAGSPYRAEIYAAAQRLIPPALVHIEIRNMAFFMERADLAIGAGGVSALERCCLGLPSILVVLAANQQLNADALAEAGATIVIDEAKLDSQAFAEAIRVLVQEQATLRRMSAAAARIADGLGAVRVRKHCYPSP